MKEKIRKLVSHELVSGSFYIFIGTSIGNFLAFLLNIYFARSLSYTDYGTLAALLSFFGLVVVPAASMGAVVTRFSTRFISLKENNKAGALYRKFFFYLCLGSTLGLILSFFLSGPISSFLRITDALLVPFVIVTVCANYFLTLNLGLLNSLLKFKYISFSYIVAGITKITAGVLFVILGFSVYGGIGAVLALIVVQFFITLFPIRSLIASGKSKVNLPVREILIFSIPATVAAASLFSFVSSDVILVKHFFSAKDAGLYGALSLVGKVIFYFTLPIPFVMFPLLVRKHSKNEPINKLFYLALLIVAIPSVLITLIYFIFPTFIANVFLGGRDYLAITPYLGLFGIFLTLYSINNTFVNYFLSIGKTRSSIIVLFFAAVQIIGIGLYHGNFTQVIYVSILTSILLLLSLSVFFLKNL